MSPCLCPKTLEAIKRKQLEKYHKAPEDEKEAIECNPYVIFHQALKNCQPIIGLSSITRGGKTYQVKTRGWEHIWPGENSLGKRMRWFHPFSSGFPLLGKSHFAIWVKTGPKKTVQDHAPACECGNSFSALVSAPLTR